MGKSSMSVVAEEIPTLVKIAGIVTNRPESEVENIITSELGFLKLRFDLSSALRDCTPQSLIDCVKQAIRDNLSLNPTAGLVYIYPQNLNAGTKAAPNWVKVAHYEPSPDGRISLARQVGRILDIERPSIQRDEKGRVISGSVRILKPSFPEPRWEVYSFDQHDFSKWEKYSKKKNKGKTNELYISENGGPDSEFIRAKIVKHSLKKLGTNTNEMGSITPVKIEPMFSPEVNRAEVLDSNPGADESWTENL